MNIKFNNKFNNLYLEEIKKIIDTTSDYIIFDAADNHPPVAFVNNIINYMVNTKGLEYAQKTKLIGFNEIANRIIISYLTWE